KVRMILILICLTIALAATIAVVGLALWPAPGALAAEEVDEGHQPVEKIPRLHGRSLMEVLSELGAPDEEKEFSMEWRNTDPHLRRELNSLYANDPGIRIRELHWRY